MRRSTDRILTTHVGSLPRPSYLLDLVHASSRDAAEPERLAAEVERAVVEIVAQQVASGVDVVNDGEAGKESYATYVRERLSGFEGEGEQTIALADVEAFPSYVERVKEKRGTDVSKVVAPPACCGPIAVKAQEAVATDVELLQAAIAAAGAEEGFLSAASPGVISLFFANHHYSTREEYVFAIAEAMRHEYETIAASGLVLQIDCPDLAMGRHATAALSGGDLEAFREYARVNVEALNHATANIAPENMRMHLCWGNYEGPHHLDVPLREIIDIVFSARPNGLALEGANPRHEHEWAVFEEVELPEGKLLIPGVVDSTSNYIEHPELIAQRLVRYGRLVGRENVIAGSDCGFSTIAGAAFVEPTLVWAKLEAMAAGARIADAALR